MKADALGSEVRLYAFGPYVFDPLRGRLWRDGAPVSLTQKNVEVLLALVEARGEVVAKETLLQRVWPDTTVEENNLARHISMLRKALLEHPDQHEFIVTVPGHGYRFVAPVTELSALPEPVDRAARAPAFVEQHDPRIDGGRRAWPRGVVRAAAAFAIVAATLMGALLRGRPAQQPQQRKLWRLTFNAPVESEPSWSPHGEWVAYSSARSGNLDVWIQSVGDGDPIRVTSSSANDWQPDWSPDGRYIAFRSERDQGGLFIVPAFGGPERRITNFGYRPLWSPDGSRLLFVSAILPAVSEAPKVYVVDGEGGSPRTILTSFLAQFTSFQVAWHPDGRRVSIHGLHREAGWSFWTVDLDGSNAVRSDVLLQVRERQQEAGVMFGPFRWSPAGDALYFEGRSHAVTNVWRVGVEPGSLRWVSGPDRLTTGAGLDTDFAVSPEGHRLAFSIRSEQTRLWSFPFDAVAGHITGTGEPLTPEGAEAFFPDIPAAGSEIVYRTVRRGRQELWKQSLQGDAVRLVAGEADTIIFTPRWSHDGSSLVYRRDRVLDPQRARVERAVMLLSADGGQERFLTTPGSLRMIPYDWSSDAQWILGSCEAGPARLFGVCVLPVSSAPQAERQARIITSHPAENAYQTRFSPNDKWISFNAISSTDAAVSTIYVVPTGGGSRTMITDGRFFDDKPRWSPDGRVIYFVSNRTGFLNVWGRQFDPMRGVPLGDPFPVTNFDHPSRIIAQSIGTLEIAVMRDRLIVPITDVTGSTWVLEDVHR